MCSSPLRQMASTSARNCSRLVAPYGRSSTRAPLQRARQEACSAGGPGRWSSLLGVPAFPELPLSLVVLSDPTFSGVQDLLAGLDFAFPQAAKIVGQQQPQQQPPAASPAATPAAADDATPSDGPSTSGGSGSVSGASGVGLYRRGASVMCIHGEVQLDLVIAQGCRPLNCPPPTTRPPHHPSPPQRHSHLSSGLPLVYFLPQATQGATLTLPMPANPHRPGQDFLIRALRGFDSEQSLVVGDYVRAGQRVRFMVRDKQGAQEDLASHGLAFKRKQLQAMMTGGPSQPPQPFGMLMFTCNGRGSGLYGEESYDARTMASYVPVPCAGFMCNGSCKLVAVLMVAGRDFLIRALRGFDSEQSLVVGDYVRAGQRVRFMVRDKQGAQEDLASHGLAFKRKQLQAMMTGGPSQPPQPFGMLMFTCNGRGSGLYGEESYDARTMASYVPVPCAGFMCNGEIGRVGSTTHLHGFTCAQSVEAQGQAQGEEAGREGTGGASAQEGAQ
ncbi:hypothetical protein TSOC_000565 [Tetrabaena socialis]|uniref:FIST C-domain domain-containing protein n=1 Tax=Tetrabaena socialis TaxID=47790 RepID=A0A2J8AJ07_9CHLO|nr:hypothetical protein TSOC_000565 [Tetrabaena socialis]|eukprot:PNH12493.1 hypothetical protein TSOC_000565 [Tetrabaena socialis]